jgi:hypothetical protein
MYCNFIGGGKVGKSTANNSLKKTKFNLFGTPLVLLTFTPFFVGISSLTEYNPPF